MTSQRYVYSCAGCAGNVQKTPCEKPPTPTAKVGKDGREKKEREHKVEYAGLHGWKCNNCGDGVRVNRKMRGANDE